MGAEIVPIGIRTPYRMMSRMLVVITAIARGRQFQFVDECDERDFFMTERYALSMLSRKIARAFWCPVALFEGDSLRMEARP